MDYTLAITAGYTSLIIVGLAAGYYPLHLLLERRLRADAHPDDCARLSVAVAIARFTHPFLASLISAMAAYHVYVMWMTYPMNVKMWSGLLLSATVIFMANTGWALKVWSGRRKLRFAHRCGMYIMLLLAVVHKFI